MKKTLFVVLLVLFTAGSMAAGEPVEGEDYVSGQVIVKFRTTVTDALTKSGAAESAPGGGEAKRLLSRYGVTFNAGDTLKPVFRNFRSNLNKKKLLHARSKAGEILSEREQRLLARENRAPAGADVPDLSGVYLISLTSGETVAEAVARFGKNPAVEYAEPNYIMHTDTTPNDPYYADASIDYQWYLNNTGNPYPASGIYTLPPGTADADIDAPEAWDLMTDAYIMIVGVVDSGIDYNHPDLAGNLWINSTEQSGTPGVDDDGNGYVDDIYGYDFHYNTGDPMDYLGHGTHCAGTIGARGNNATDVTGVCWNSRLMAVKIGNDSGQIFTENVIEGFYYAVSMGADVLSNSYRDRKSVV